MLSEHVLHFGVPSMDKLTTRCWKIDWVMQHHLLTGCGMRLPLQLQQFRTRLCLEHMQMHLKNAGKGADREASKTQHAPTCTVSTSKTSVMKSVISSTASSLAPLVLGKTTSTRLSAKVAKTFSKSRFTPNLEVPTCMTF